MAQVKAPDIKCPAKKEYRTTEDYISGFTRHCSNEYDSHMAPPPVYAPWLTPDHARSVALIAKENTIEQAVEWLKANVIKYYWYDPYEDNEGFNGEALIYDFKKAMEEIKV